jgi:hypothetical protein
MSNAPGTRRGQRSALRVLLVAAGGAVFGVAGFLLAEIFRTPAPIDHAARAQAALRVEPGQLAYVRVRAVTRSPNRGEATAQRRTIEQWFAAEPLGWRTTTTSGPGSGSRDELAFADGVQWSYDAQRRRLQRRSGLAAGGDAARPPSVLGGERRLVLGTRTDVSSFEHVGLTETPRGTVRRFTAARSNRRDGLTTTTYDVDPDDYRPLSGEVRRRLPTSGGDLMTSERFVVEAFKLIPLTADNSRLLTIRR